MSGNPHPLQVGTIGTVGSLVRKEIEYFTHLDLQPNQTLEEVDQDNGVRTSSACRQRPRPGFWYLLMTWGRKKRKLSRRFTPSFSSVVEVSEINSLNLISDFSYSILGEIDP
uniref:Uncharacterized protein n=1 Tax=Kalanchoe fedtschenkoi TaxID=63787 RepID=A0A7N0TRD6_KALFE